MFFQQIKRELKMLQRKQKLLKKELASMPAVSMLNFKFF